MSPPEDENGAGGLRTPSGAVHEPHDHHSHRQTARRRGSDRSVLGDHAPVVECGKIREIGPDLRRAQPLYVVEVCPFACGDQHVHRGMPGVRRAPCRGGRYRVGPVTM